MKRVLSFAIIAVLGACSSESATAPDSRQPTDLATVLREMTLPSLTGVPAALTGVTVPVPTPVAPANCTYSASVQGFQCPTIVAGGLTITQSYTLFDAAGRPQAAFDANTTAAVRSKASLAGTVTDAGTRVTIDQVQDMTLSGLLTSTHVLNGTNVMKMNGTVANGGSTLPVAMTMTMTMSNLVMPTATTGAAAYPLSGVITSDMTVALDGGTSISVRTEMTFNGTSKVSVVSTIGGLSQRCTVDLSNPASTCA